jgi:hypothetical protein
VGEHDEGKTPKGKATMSNIQDSDTTSIDTPKWAVEHETRDDFPGGVMHRGDKLVWGSSSVWLERFDVNDKPGEVDVMITTRTADYPDEEFSMPLTSAGEVWPLLGKLLESITAVDLAREWSKRN